MRKLEKGSPIWILRGSDNICWCDKVSIESIIGSIIFHTSSGRSRHTDDAGYVFAAENGKTWFSDEQAATAAVAKARSKALKRNGAKMMQRRIKNDAKLLNLKMEMAAAHPDRGGSSVGFIEAYKRYVKAKKQLQTRPSSGDGQ
jgi:hypothetical protein